jgi:hypothetical protein
MQKTPITHLIIDTSSSNEFYDGNCDYCLIQMTTEYILHLLGYMDEIRRLHHADDSVYSIEVWDSSPAYFGFNDKFQELRDVDGHLATDVPPGEPIILAADPQFNEADFQRVECQSVQIVSEDIWWTAYVKNTNIRIESAHIEKKTLLRILRSLGGEREPRKPAQTNRPHPAIQQIHDLLYLDIDGTREFYNDMKNWDAETPDRIAEIIARYIPRPKPVSSDKEGGTPHAKARDESK